MKSNLNCGYCGEFLGNVHMQERGLLLKQHFRTKHPRELEEMKMARRALNALMDEYSFKFTFADQMLKGK